MSKPKPTTFKGDFLAREQAAHGHDESAYQRFLKTAPSTTPVQDSEAKATPVKPYRSTKKK